MSKAYQVKFKSTSYVLHMMKRIFVSEILLPSSVSTMYTNKKYWVCVCVIFYVFGSSIYISKITNWTFVFLYRPLKKTKTKLFFFSISITINYKDDRVNKKKMVLFNRTMTKIVYALNFWDARAEVLLFFFEL